MDWMLPPRYSSWHQAPSKALSPMVWTVEGSARMLSLWYWNARAPMSSRPSLQSILAIWALKNASSPMVFSVEGNLT